MARLYDDRLDITADFVDISKCIINYQLQEVAPQELVVPVQEEQTEIIKIVDNLRVIELGYQNDLTYYSELISTIPGYKLEIMGIDRRFNGKYANSEGGYPGLLLVKATRIRAPQISLPGYFAYYAESDKVTFVPLLKKYKQDADYPTYKDIAQLAITSIDPKNLRDAYSVVNAFSQYLNSIIYLPIYGSDKYTGCEISRTKIELGSYDDFFKRFRQDYDLLEIKTMNNDAISQLKGLYTSLEFCPKWLLHGITPNEGIYTRKL